MDYKEALKRALPGLSFINYTFAIASFISSILGFLMGIRSTTIVDSFPSTIQTLLYAAYLTYWNFWFIIAGPPIIGYLYLSQEDENYWILSVKNIVMVVVIYMLKILNGFQFTV